MLCEKPLQRVGIGRAVPCRFPSFTARCIGCTGRPPTILWHGNKIAIPPIPSDTWELPGVKVEPASLYIEQLRERLGPAAVKNIGY